MEQQKRREGLGSFIIHLIHSLPSGEADYIINGVAHIYDINNFEGHVL